MQQSGDLVDRMMAYESGQLSFDDVRALFQELIDSGMAWQLQGVYGRTAARLIGQGYCHSAEGQPDPVNGCTHVWAGDDFCVHCGASRNG